MLELKELKEKAEEFPTEVSHLPSGDVEMFSGSAINTDWQTWHFEIWG